MNTQKSTLLKKECRQVNFDFELSVIDETNNCINSTNYASRKYKFLKLVIEHFINRKV